MRGAAGDGAVLRGALRALAGLPWVARRRHVVPLEIERALRLVA